MNQNQNPYSFKIGAFKCTVFHDLDFVYQAMSCFTNVESGILAKSLHQYGQTLEKIPSPYISLLLERDDQKILVDTGLGFMKEPVKFQGRSMNFEGQLLNELSTHQVDPSSITHLMLTHFHPDHIGGVCNSSTKLHFPNAQHIAHQDEWDYWTGAAFTGPSIFGYFIDQNIRPLHNKNLHLLKGAGAEVLPGITFIQVPGHTPGQFALHIASEGKDLLYISDVWLHPLHIKHLDWQSFDLDHDLAKKSRIRMLELAHKKNMLVQSFHFPFPGLGHIDKIGDSWHWLTAR